jgi:hypothetical protein
MQRGSPTTIVPVPWYGTGTSTTVSDREVLVLAPIVTVHQCAHNPRMSSSLIVLVSLPQKSDDGNNFTGKPIQQNTNCSQGKDSYQYQSKANTHLLLVKVEYLSTE